MDRKAIEEMFAEIHQRGRWDISAPLLWAYYFTDEQAERLRAAASDLEDMGYRYVSVFPAEKEDASDADLWSLHVERVEVHTVDSLLARNAALEEFAETHDLRSFDGPDVGQASPE